MRRYCAALTSQFGAADSCAPNGGRLRLDTLSPPDFVPAANPQRTATVPLSGGGEASGHRVARTTKVCYAIPQVRRGPAVVLFDLDKTGTINSKGYDICIVGAGAAGISLAVDLVRRGMRVVVLEGGRAGYDKSS